MDRPDTAANGQQERARLLLLYSDPGPAASLMQILPHELYQLVSCPISGQSAGWIDELQPDLVLLTPPAEPAALLEACAAARSQTEAPVVALCERGDELLIARALATGIDDYLLLPIGGRELSARIEAMVRRAHRATAGDGRRRIGDLVLSAVDHSVERKGRRILLSPMEFRLLACLASAPGKVLTHQTLMSRVWGVEYVDARHYLRVYIRYLREKLEDDPNHPQLILSEWGVGYRLHPTAETAVAHEVPALQPAPSTASV